MSFKTLRLKVRWWNLVIGIIFVILSVYLDRVGLANANPLWLWIALISPMIALVVVILTVPRWQFLVGMAVVAYAVFWFYSQWFPKPEGHPETSQSYASTDTESVNPI